LRAVIFANGVLNDASTARAAVRSGDLVIAADGGSRHCRELGLKPAILIGDFDSLGSAELAAFEMAGSEIIRHPARKDFTDLELALRHARDLGASEIVVIAALGERWDQTLANLLLPAAADLSGVRISLLDGPQEIMLLRGNDDRSEPAHIELGGQPGDTVSLIPLGGDARGITTHGLEYPLADETLFFGNTRGLSNVMLGETASVYLKEGVLLCTIIHAARQDEQVPRESP
jgi:thiamine pyrophosphokinase